MNKYLIITILGIILLPACSKETAEKESFTRTILVYLGRDNNLYGSSDDKIESMLKGWNGQNGNLVFYEDKKGSSPCLMEAYREKGINKTRILETYEEENSASPEVFSRVVKLVQSRFPSDSYGLIVFSHASGWLPESTLTSPRSVIIDGKAEMDLKDFANSIPDNSFQFIIFEACFMAGIEVAYELKDKTDYIVSSSAEILSPGFRPVYAETMNKLFSKVHDLQSFIEKVHEYFETQSGASQSSTLSLIKTAGLPELKDWVRKNMSTPISIDPEEIQHFDRYTYHLFFDFEDYFSHATDDRYQKEELNRLLDACIIYKASTPTFMLPYSGFLIEKHSGLTTYIEQPNYPYLNEEYKKLKWYKEALQGL
ncbi:clostripain-related cysteine peptidase [Parabacteroides sp.]